MQLSGAFLPGEVPSHKEAEPPGGIQLLEEELSFREAQLREVVALWKEITRPREAPPLREIEPPRETWPPKEITPPDGSESLRGTALHREVNPGCLEKPGRRGDPSQQEGCHIATAMRVGHAEVNSVARVEVAGEGDVLANHCPAAGQGDTTRRGRYTAGAAAAPSRGRKTAKATITAATFETDQVRG